MADDRLSEFTGYIPQVKVEMEGVITHQNFYVMETASFEVLLGMPWVAGAQLVSSGWKEQNRDEDSELDAYDEEDEEEGKRNQVAVVRRFQIINDEVQNSDKNNELLE
ncbi:9046_t:CDS:2, partial [Cetraspora pellucida]